MLKTTPLNHDIQNVTREDLVALLNEDLAGEFQAIISYVIYSQVLKGPQYMNIAAELETHAAEELAHALIIAGQIDYLGGMPLTVPKPVQTSTQAEDMLHFDLRNENDTIVRYRQRVRQCEALGEYAVAEQIRDILVQEQDHQIALATALGVPVPNVTRLEEVAPPKQSSASKNVRIAIQSRLPVETNAPDHRIAVRVAEPETRDCTPDCPPALEPHVRVFQADQVIGHAPIENEYA